MTSGEKAEPERSAISSTDPECGPGNGPHCYDHDPACCHCGKPRPEPSTECEGGCQIYSAPPCRDPAKCQCAGEWWKHGCKHSLPPEPRCTCGPDEACSECPETPAEPPLTPEEEEMVSGRCTCGETACESELCDCDCAPCPVDHAREANEMACQDCLAGVHGPNTHREIPPQPDRRPPYLLAYSVQGHLYEVALPGDATVAALDGRLVITHQLGPVAGICQIAPITSEESSGSA